MRDYEYERMVKAKTASKVLTAAATVGWIANTAVLIVPPALAGIAYSLGDGIGVFFLSLVFFCAISCPLTILTQKAMDNYSVDRANKLWAAEQQRLEDERIIREFKVNK